VSQPGDALASVLPAWPLNLLEEIRGTKIALFAAAALSVFLIEGAIDPSLTDTNLRRKRK
jgi:hypothetical protein